MTSVADGFKVEMVSVEAPTDREALEICARWMHDNDATLLCIQNLAKDATGPDVVVLQMFVEPHTSKPTTTEEEA